MKFRCERDLLTEALAVVGRAVSSRGGVPTALTGIRAELSGDRLVLTGSDLDLTITTELTVNGESDGVVVLPAKLTAEIVRALEAGAVQVSVGDEEAEITAGAASFSVLLLAPEGFPVPKAVEAEPVGVSSAELATALRQVVRAASQDETRSVALSGVLLASEAGGLRLVATDSYRLALRDLPGVSILGDQSQVVVPARALSELTRVLAEGDQAEVRFGEGIASFKVGSTQLITRLIEVEYPDYQRLIPQNQPNVLTVGREALLEATKRVALMLQNTNTPIRLVMQPDHLELMAVTPDRGEAREEIPARHEGGDLMVAFNWRFLAEGIEATTGDEIALSTFDAQKPALIRSKEDQDFLYLLMPVKVI